MTDVDRLAASAVVATARAELIALAERELAAVRAAVVADWNPDCPPISEAQALGHGEALVREVDAWSADRRAAAGRRRLRVVRDAG